MGNLPTLLLVWIPWISSFLSRLGDASIGFLSIRLGLSFKQLWVDAWWISNRCKLLKEFSGSLLLLKMWDFIFTSFSHSLVINIKSFSISGVMDVLIEFLNQKKFTRKRKISGRWFNVERSIQRNLMLRWSEISPSFLELIECQSEEGTFRIQIR
jgi:hypothetical protein